MPENNAIAAVGVLSYLLATHAPLMERYMAGTGYVEIGDDPAPGKPWRLDPETGAEIHAIQRDGPHTYLTDYKVGSSYPATVFVFGLKDGDGAASHEELENFLRDHDLWSDALNPVVVPDGGPWSTDGSMGWKPGFQYRPPSRKPYSLSSVAENLREKFDLDTHELLGGDLNRGFQAYIG